jgi:dienelactone hydrolase
MNRSLFILCGIIALSLVAGCQSDVPPAIRAQTNLNNQVTIDWMDSDRLLKQKTIDDHRAIERPDGVTIDAWTIRAKIQPAKGTMVILHGLGESKVNYMTTADLLANRGYDAVLIDLRCHGKSTGKCITLGAKEQADVQAMLDALVEAKLVAAKPVTMVGVSLGAVTAILCAAENPNVVGVLAVAPWANATNHIKRNTPWLMDKDVSQTLEEVAKFGEFSLSDAGADLALKQYKGRVFLVHGLLDLSGVPLADSEALYDVAAGSKRLHIISPGVEQMTLMLLWEQWLADRADEVAQGTMKPGKTTIISNETKKPKTP